MSDVKIVYVTFQNVSWVVEATGLSYDEVLDALNEAVAGGYVCTLTVPTR